ncbi:MAG: hypothetical protein ACLP9Y_32870 [Mycobacterium sp.]
MGWLRRNKKNQRPVRQETVHQRPPHPLYLDGSTSWKAYTEPDGAQQLIRLPVGSEIIVDAVPEPNNRHDPTAVALLYQGSRVGYLHRSLSRSLFGAIRAANAAGYHVLLRAKTGNTPLLEVRVALAADLYYWLSLPAQQRRTQFFELAWMKTVYQDYYQDRRRTLLGNNDSLIVACTFSTGPRAINPYGCRPPPQSTPAHPAAETYADVHAAGLHIGELRTSMKRRSDEAVHQILSGRDHGMARLQRWPDNIELRICVADSDGHLSKSSEPFLWLSERREANFARLRTVWAEIDAEKVDGESLGHCKFKVADLKRVGDLDGAVALVMKMVDAAEQGAAIANRAPHAWVTLEAAIILRKLKDKQGEIAVLERYLQHCPPGQLDAKITERLDKLR